MGQQRLEHWQRFQRRLATKLDQCACLIEGMGLNVTDFWSDNKIGRTRGPCTLLCVPSLQLLAERLERLDVHVNRQ